MRALAKDQADRADPIEGISILRQREKDGGLYIKLLKLWFTGDTCQFHSHFTTQSMSNIRA